ncbi:MAG: phosphomannomutase/phosphoglucomutase, partial [Planctomycetes bacterium]|nr:phosphomannomutase/phosphoglucomutase [Planctomycetota bacterium]
PISYANGIGDIERMCEEPYCGSSGQRGTLTELDLLAAYGEHVLAFADLQGSMKLSLDASNGMAGHTLPVILPALKGVQVDSLFTDPDGTFPNHEANPLKEEILDFVRELVREKKSDLGVCFDGDADRCCFVDETGTTVPADLMTALLARDFLSRNAGAAVVYDLRSSWVVKQVIEEAGGRAIRDRVGHSFIKGTMRKEGAIFAGELSGHFYFKDNFVCDSGVIAMVSALNLLTRPENQERTFSDLVQDLRRYHSTGEINFRVEDKEAAIAGLRVKYSQGRQDDLDGITVEFGQLGDDSWWWFNVRQSNTEPLLRLNLEASSAELCAEKRAELCALLGQPE